MTLQAAIFWAALVALMELSKAGIMLVRIANSVANLKTALPIS